MALEAELKSAAKQSSGTDISRVAHRGYFQNKMSPTCATMVKGGLNGICRRNILKEIINAAIDGFTAQKAHLNQQIAELRAMLNGGSPQAAPASEPTPAKRRRMSAAGRRRIAAAQRARWAEVRGESPRGPATAKTSKPKRRISPEGLKRIIAATKKRWRLQRAAAKTKSAKAA